MSILETFSEMAKKPEIKQFNIVNIRFCYVLHMMLLIFKQFDKVNGVLCR
jgi:hypothetical protein